METAFNSVSRFVNYLLNRCPGCGYSATTVCARCWYILNRVSTAASPLIRGLIEVEKDPFVQRVLYRWDDREVHESSILREILLSSKENPSSEMMRLWGEEFYRRAMIANLLSRTRNWILICPPGRSGQGERDHAGALAEALQAASGGHFQCEFQMFDRVGESRRSRSGSQKTKSRIEREQLEFQLSAKGRRLCSRGEGYIFIDDIIATGATAKAAWIALGRPRAFESWSIAYKVREFEGLNMKHRVLEGERSGDNLEI